MYGVAICGTKSPHHQHYFDGAGGVDFARITIIWWPVDGGTERQHEANFPA